MSVLWHRAGTTHKDRIGDCGARCFMIEIKHQGLDSLRQYSRVPVDFSETATPIVWIAARLFSEFKNWDPCSELIAEGLTLELLGNSARGSVAELKAPVWLSRVTDKLRDEFALGHSTSGLADEAGVHPVHLATVFRKFHGVTIGEYQQRLRVAHASKLLIDNKRELAEIAYDSGFSDQSHFNRLFKRHTGMTPAEFRRSIV